MDLAFKEHRSIDHKLNVNCNLYLSVISSLPLFQEHYQYLYKAMLSLVGSTDSGIFCSYMDRHGRILKTDKGNLPESMEFLVWRFQKTRRDEFVWQTFLEAFIFARLIDKVKQSLKTFCTLMKNSFDIYFCCFLLSCWVSQLILQYTYTQQNAAVYFALYCQCYCLMPRFPSTLAIELVVLLEGQYAVNRTEKNHKSASH